MGSTGYPRGVTFTEAIKEELGLGIRYKVLAKAAGPSDEPGRNVTWFALERIEGLLEEALPRGERFILEVLWYPGDRNYGPTIKLVDENMGPGTLDVPDKVWDAVPNPPPDASTYSIEWRRQVAEHKAKYPLRIADLVEGEWYIFPDALGNDDAKVQYLGERYSGRSKVKAFLYPTGVFRLRRWQEKHGRARLAF